MKKWSLHSIAYWYLGMKLKKLIFFTGGFYKDVSMNLTLWPYHILTVFQVKIIL